jgi:hypothetical protein
MVQLDRAWLQILIALDQLANTLLRGYADETLSARAWRNKNRHSWYKVIDWIFFWQRNHCEQSWIAERERKQLPEIYYRVYD